MTKFSLITQNIGIPYNKDFEKWGLGFLKEILNEGTLPPENFTRMMQKLSSLDTDVIALQEVKTEHKPLFEKAIPEYVPIWGGETGGEYRLTLVRRGMAVNRVENIYARHKGKDVPAAIAVNVNGIWVINSHFKAYNRPLSTKQLEEVLGFAQQQEQAIIAGDFNMTRLDTRIREATQQFRYISKGTGHTFTLFGYKQTFDYILAKGIPQHPNEQCKVKNVNTHWLNDHLAVYAVLELNAQAERN